MHWSSLSPLLLVSALTAQDIRQVRGIVVDEENRPLAGVAVCPFTASAPFTTAELEAQPATHTGADGTFSLQWDVWQHPPRHDVLFVAEGRVHVAAGMAYVDMTPIVLPRGRTLAGMVRDRDGKPVAGVRVEARDWLTQCGLFAHGSTDGWSTAPEPRTAVRTDASGRFVLQGTCESAIQVQVGGEGFTRRASGPLAAGASWDAVVERAPVVTVQVVDAAGVPVPGVTLRATSSSPSDERLVGYSDQRGRWQLTWFGAGPIDVVAHDREYRPLGSVQLAHAVEQVQLAARPAEEPPTVEAFPVPGTVAVRGRVLDGDTPVAGAWVRTVGKDQAGNVDLFVLDGMGRGPGAVRTGADGTFRLYSEPGSHVLVAAVDNSGRNWRMPGHQRNPTPLPIEVPADQEPDAIDLRLQPLVGVRGQLDATNLPRGCMLRFLPFREGWSWSGEDWDFQDRFPLATDGKFTAEGLQARRYTVQLLVPRGFRQGLPDKLLLAVADLAGRAELRLDAKVRPGAVRGVVRSDVPFDRLAVLSLPANDPAQALFGCAHYWGPVAPVQRDGSYRLTNPPGQRALLVLDVATGVVLHRGALTAVEPGTERAQDIDVAARPVDVEARGLGASPRPWLDIVVAEEDWPSGLGQMVALGVDRRECGIGIALEPGAEATRLWLAGPARLVLRTSRGVRSDGKDVLDDVTVDPGKERRVVLDGGAKK